MDESACDGPAAGRTICPALLYGLGNISAFDGSSTQSEQRYFVSIEQGAFAPCSGTYI